VVDLKLELSFVSWIDEKCIHLPVTFLVESNMTLMRILISILMLKGVDELCNLTGNSSRPCLKHNNFRMTFIA
jgi:hypothetical protein